jgi:soluble lytic murein transglycosylase-like protein
MEIEKAIQQACDVYGVPMALARAVCMYESGANDNLTSGAGAHGYFQVMPATFA